MKLFDSGVEKPKNSPDESNKTLVGVANQLSGLLEENGHSQLLLQCTVNVRKTGLVALPLHSVFTVSDIMLYIIMYIIYIIIRRQRQ